VAFLQLIVTFALLHPTPPLAYLLHSGRPSLRRQLRPSMVDVLREKIASRTTATLDEEDKLICQYYGTVDWFKSVASPSLISCPLLLLSLPRPPPPPPLTPHPHAPRPPNRPDHRCLAHTIPPTAGCACTHCPGANPFCSHEIEVFQ